MRTPIPVEVAVWAFFEEHRRCGDLDSGVENGRVWMTCDCGAALRKIVRQQETEP